MTDGRSFVRNSALNLGGLLLPFLVAVLAMPPLVRGLGVERFAVLTLAWAAFGYFGLFEWGLGRALTQAVAHRLGADRKHELPALVWTALLVLLALGTLGALAFALATPALVTRVLNVPEHLRGETIQSFYLLAISLPFLVTSTGMRGLMEAHQHFGMVNALRVPLLAFTFIGPLLVLPFSNSLVPAVATLVVGRVIGAVAHFVLCLRRYEYLRGKAVIDRATIVPLLRYGGWTTVTNVVSPIMVYVDRFFIGAILPIAAVAHYVTPYELVMKLLVIPAAILTAIFPAFAATVTVDRERMAQIYDRTQRTVVLATFPLVLVALALAHEGLHVWMGNSLPAESAIVLQWLALGTFINAIAQAPYAALQGAGRPDVIAKLHLLEMPLYALGIWYLARSMGLTGVAIAWTLRVTFDALALKLLAGRILALPPARDSATVWMLLLMLATLGGAAMLDRSGARIAYVVVVLLLFPAIAWRQLLTQTERAGLFAWLRSPRAVSDSPASIA